MEFKPYKFRCSKGILLADMYEAANGETRVTLALSSKDFRGAVQAILIADQTFPCRQQAEDWVEKEYQEIKAQLT